MTRPSPIYPNPSTAPPMPTGDGTDDAHAIPMAMQHGGRGPCLNASSRARAPHVTPPTGVGLGKLQKK
jgi:hypothetical protein